MRARGWMVWLGLSACGGDADKGPDPTDGDADTDADSDADTDADTDTDTDATTIGPAGGSLTVDDVTIVFPAGALASDTAVTLDVDVTPPVALPGTLDPLSVVIRVGPLGLSLGADAEVTMPSAAPTDAAEAWILTDDGDTTWERVGPATFAGARSAVGGGTAEYGTDGLGYLVVVDAPARVGNPCGPALGYAANSPWPSPRGCETGRRNTFEIGPATAPAQVWTWNDPSTVGVYGPVIDASGDLYVTSVRYLARLAPDGAERWRVDVRPAYPQLGTATAPILLANDLVLVCRYAGETMAAFHAADGTLAWESGAVCDAAALPAVRSDGFIVTGYSIVDPSDGSTVVTAPGYDTCANPVLDAADNVYCPSGLYNTMVALDRDLVERWRTDLGSASLDADVVVVDDAGTERIAVASPSATRAWMYPTTGGTQPGDADVPAFDVPALGLFSAGTDRLAFLTHGTAATGGIVNIGFDGVAQAPAPTPQASRLIGHWPVPVIDGDDNVYYGTFDGQVAAVNADGTLRWTVDLGVSIVRDVVVGPNGRIYAISSDSYGTLNRLHALE